MTEPEAQGQEADEPTSLYARRKRSRRSLTPLRRMLYRLAAPLAIGIVRLWWAWLRPVGVVGAERLEAAIAAHGAVIPVYWHGSQLVLARHLLQATPPGFRLGFLISPSVDGELPALLVGRVGATAIRGSSSASGARALRDYLDALVRQGVSTAITPDGPHGPRRRFKPGAVLISQVSGKPVVPMAYAATRVWRFPTWDRFVLPWPGARYVIVIGSPTVVPRGLDAASLTRWQECFGRELEQLHEQARRALDG